MQKNFGVIKNFCGSQFVSYQSENITDHINLWNLQSVKISNWLHQNWGQTDPKCRRIFTE